MAAAGAAAAAAKGAADTAAAAGGSEAAAAGLTAADAWMPAAAAELGVGGSTAAGLGTLGTSLALQGAGALAKGLAAQEANDRKMKLAKAMGDYETANAAKQTGVVNDYVSGDTPEARAAGTLAANDEAKLGFERSVGAAQANGDPNAVSGNVSQQFKDSGAASADAAMARNNKLIASLATMRAPGLAQAAQSRKYGLAASQVGGLNSGATTVGNAYGVDMGNVVPSPWAGLAGNAASGVGQGLALSDAASKTSAAIKKALAP